MKYRIGSAEDAQDVLQEVCLAAYRGYPGFRDESAFRTWLVGIARNKCSDYFRRKSRGRELPIDGINEAVPVSDARGSAGRTAVRETLARLSESDRQLLLLFYMKELPQAEIAARLHIPVGTVKSRLHRAREGFRERYPYKPRTKGESKMKHLPDIMPAYTIRRLDAPVFSVVHEELPGMFIIPREGEKIEFGLYDRPGGIRSGLYTLEVTGRVELHGLEGAEIRSRYSEAGGPDEESVIFAQLTDTHCRYLGGMSVANGQRRILTFLDEGFSDAYGIGEENSGFPTHRAYRGIITENGGALTCTAAGDASDLAGRFEVTLGDQKYDTVRLLDLQNGNAGWMLTEYYLDRAGRTVLWRRFNRDDWAQPRFGRHWSEMLPENERLTLNGETFVHWYDCITSYIL